MRSIFLILIMNLCAKMIIISIVLAITKSYTTIMTWTRLFYVKNIGKAFERVLPEIPRE